jgi:hypothetical protein
MSTLTHHNSFTPPIMASKSHQPVDHYAADAGNATSALGPLTSTIKLWYCFVLLQHLQINEILNF